MLQAVLQLTFITASASIRKLERTQGNDVIMQLKYLEKISKLSHHQELIKSEQKLIKQKQGRQCKESKNLRTGCLWFSVDRPVTQLYLRKRRSKLAESKGTGKHYNKH